MMSRLPSRPIPRLAAILSSVALASCSFAPHDVRSALPVPPSWPVGNAYLAQSEATLPAYTYRDIFTDPRLQAIIAEALVNNRDLRIAAANIQAARAQYRIQRADLFPELDGTGRYSYEGGGNGTSNFASGGTSVGNGTTGGTTGGTGTGTGTGTGGTGTGTGTGGTGTGTGTGGIGTGTGTGTGGTITTTSAGNSAFTAGIGVTAFELDLFGRIRSLSKAQLDRYYATEAAARTTRLTLVANVAQGWLTYAADQSLLQIAVDTAKSAEVSVRLTRARLDGGVAPRTDLRQAQQILFTAQSDLALQKTALAQDVNALQLLVGAPVDPALLPQSIETAQTTIASVPPGLDSRVLLRRPDVVEAEYTLYAANGEIGAARAALFPRISLTGFVGFASTALSSLFTGGAFNYSVAPTVSYPIFRAGAGIAGVRYSQAERDSALATYEETIQTAFRETADALARQGTLADQLAAQRNFEAAAQDTFVLTQARYRGGIDTYLASLDAQRSLYTAQQNLVNTLLVGASNRVTLYQVLGGDSTLETSTAGPRPVTLSGTPRAPEPTPTPTPAPAPPAR